MRNIEQTIETVKKQIEFNDELLKDMIKNNENYTHASFFNGRKDWLDDLQIILTTLENEIKRQK